MPESIPNLAGVATKDLVETIGAGNFKASYINWARTFNLLHQHAPGWYLDLVIAPDGGQVWKAPGIGGSLMLRFCHIDGTVLAAVPQAIMDNRNSSIPFEKISSRDITDTHRRGGCMCAAMTFGLAQELWAKMPLESGYSEVDVVGEKIVITETPAQKEPTKEDFLEAALQKGLSTHAAESLLGVINGNYRNGIKTLGLKDSAWVAEQNKAHEPEVPQKPATAARAKKTPAKADPSDY